ncbi:MAG: hypothetical protein NXI28_13405 [bacterium]|nr:hypothetical protein [bacterium]
MLNELIDLSRSLAQHDIGVPSVHPDIKSVRKASFARVLLSQEGVDSMELHGVDAMPSMAGWTLRNGQQNSFPAVSIKVNGVCPLFVQGLFSEDIIADASGYHLENGKKVKVAQDAQVKALLTLLDASLSTSACETAIPYVSKVAQRAGQLTSLADGEASAVHLVFERFADLADPPDMLFQSIFETIKKQLGTPKDDFISFAAGLLVDGTAQFYFDVVESRKTRPVGHQDHIGIIADALNDRVVNSSPEGLCMVSGESSSLHKGNFPQLNLPYLGQTYLYSRNSVTPATARYGNTEIKIGADIVRRLGGSLAWMCGGEEGERWTHVPSEKDGQTDLLLAYSKSLPDAPLASFLADTNDDLANETFDSFDDEPEFSPSSFQAKSEAVIDAFKKQQVSLAGLPDVFVTILRQVDPANRTAVYSSSFSPEEVVDAANRWRNAFAKRHLPPVKVVLPGRKKGDKARPTRLRAFPPFRLLSLSRKRFIRGGTQQVEVIGFTASTVLSVFIGPPSQPTLQMMLKRLVSQLDSAIEAYSQAEKLGLKERQKLDAKSIVDGLSAIHLLLHQLKRPGEVYMSQIAYQLGQFLSGCDELHLGYCLDQRGGQIPPKLLGNANVSRAGKNPLQALAVLERRLPVYYNWAKKLRNEARANPASAKTESEKGRMFAIRNGFFAPFNLQSLAKSIHAQLPDIQIDDRFRAELLLGYVAGMDRPAKKTQDNAETFEATAESS